MTSCKMITLLSLVSTLLAEGHRVLIFSQWIMILDTIELVLNQQSILTYRIDGQVCMLYRVLMNRLQ